MNFYPRINLLRSELVIEREASALSCHDIYWSRAQPLPKINGKEGLVKLTATFLSYNFFSSGFQTANEIAEQC